MDGCVPHQELDQHVGSLGMSRVFRESQARGDVFRSSFSVCCAPLLSPRNAMKCLFLSQAKTQGKVNPSPPLIACTCTSNLCIRAGHMILECRSDNRARAVHEKKKTRG